MGSGCGDSIVENPSSSGQLPVPVALNALSPTLFGIIIHDFPEKVKRFFYSAVLCQIAIWCIMTSVIP